MIRVCREGETAVLEVEHTGFGIAEGDLEHVFERFLRGEKSRSRSTGGAGNGPRHFTDSTDRRHGIFTSPRHALSSAT